MANHLSITASVLVVLFSISYARFTADLPGGVTLTDEPETVNSIFLPSEKPQPESGSDVKLNLPVDGDVQPDENRQDPPSLPVQTTAETSGETEPEPLTVITFRPINRHFPRNPLMPLRNGHRCRHMFRRGSSIGGGGPLLKRWGSRFNNGPKDVIISSARRDAGDEVAPSTGGDRETPMRWASTFIPRRSKLPTWRNDVGWTNNEEMVKAIKDKHHNLHRHVEIEERKKEQEQNQEPKVEIGFVKKIRKFLDHF